jgi:electron transfer flavoprotein alpha subunit
MFIYLLNSFNNKSSIFNIKKLNDNNQILYITYNKQENLKNNIKNYFTKFVMLINNKDYKKMDETQWINKNIIDNLKKYENSIVIYPIKNIFNIEILSFIGNFLKIKVVSESLNFENKFFSNILNLKINIFSESIYIENIYLNIKSKNFIYNGLYLKNNWQDEIEELKVKGIE